MKKLNIWLQNLIYPENKYYTITKDELIKIAKQRNVDAGFVEQGIRDKQSIIDKLNEKDKINRDFWTLFFTILTLIIAMVGIIVTIIIN